MVGEQSNYQNSYSQDPNLRIRNLEEKQRILKNQLLLIGKNLVEMKEKNNHDILEIRKNLEIIKDDMGRLTSFLDSVSEEFPQFARKDDLEILSKQMRMFKPFGEKK